MGREYQPADLTTTPTTGSLFNGREICVLSGDDKVSKQDLEKYIHEQGGTVVQYRGMTSQCLFLCVTTLSVEHFSTIFILQAQKHIVLLLGRRTSVSEIFWIKVT